MQHKKVVKPSSVLGNIGAAGIIAIMLMFAYQLEAVEAMPRNGDSKAIMTYGFPKEMTAEDGNGAGPNQAAHEDTVDWITFISKETGVTLNFLTPTSKHIPAAKHNTPEEKNTEEKPITTGEEITEAKQIPAAKQSQSPNLSAQCILQNIASDVHNLDEHATSVYLTAVSEKSLLEDNDMSSLTLLPENISKPYHKLIKEYISLYTTLYDDMYRWRKNGGLFVTIYNAFESTTSTAQGFYHTSRQVKRTNTDRNEGFDTHVDRELEDYLELYSAFGPVDEDTKAKLRRDLEKSNRQELDKDMMKDILGFRRHFQKELHDVRNELSSTKEEVQGFVKKVNEDGIQIGSLIQRSESMVRDLTRNHGGLEEYIEDMSEYLEKTLKLHHNKSETITKEFIKTLEEYVVLKHDFESINSLKRSKRSPDMRRSKFTDPPHPSMLPEEEMEKLTTASPDMDNVSNPTDPSTLSEKEMENLTTASPDLANVSNPIDLSTLLENEMENLTTVSANISDFLNSIDPITFNEEQMKKLMSPWHRLEDKEESDIACRDLQDNSQLSEEVQEVSEEILELIKNDNRTGAEDLYSHLSGAQKQVLIMNIFCSFSVSESVDPDDSSVEVLSIILSEEKVAHEFRDLLKSLKVAMSREYIVKSCNRTLQNHLDVLSEVSDKVKSITTTAAADVKLIEMTEENFVGFEAYDSETEKEVKNASDKLEDFEDFCLSMEQRWAKEYAVLPDIDEYQGEPRCTHLTEN